MKKLALIATLSLGACATLPMPSDIARADYGPPPQEPEAAARAYLRGVLPELETARFQPITGPRQVWSYSHAQRAYGWGVCYRLSVEGGRGERMHFFLIHNDRVIQHEYQAGNAFTRAAGWTRGAGAQIMCERTGLGLPPGAQPDVIPK